MLGRPAITPVKFAKECREKKKRAFSTYCSLKEVLMKYVIDSNGTDYFLYKPTKFKTPISTLNVAWKIFCSG
jgi:hypothetical protein